MQSQDLLDIITKTADEFKAEDIKVLKVGDICDFADYFVIMSGTSITHVQSISEEIYYKTKHVGSPPNNQEGKTQAEWTLLDFGDIVVHVFLPMKRELYDLEGLWSEAEVIALWTAPKADVAKAKAMVDARIDVWKQLAGEGIDTAARAHGVLDAGQRDAVADAIRKRARRWR